MRDVQRWAAGIGMAGLSAMLMSLSAQAEVIRKEAVVHDRKAVLGVPIDATSVRCSIQGYGLSSLKVSAPGLEQITVFNHANPGEALPCVSAGPCSAHQPSEVLADGEGEDYVNFHVLLREVTELDTVSKTCDRRLVETVDAVIRGLPFGHLREAPLAQLPYDLCLALSP